MNPYIVIAIIAVCLFVLGWCFGAESCDKKWCRVGDDHEAIVINGRGVYHVTRVGDDDQW